MLWLSAEMKRASRGVAILTVSAAALASDPERQALLDALVRHRWKPGPAAESLGISRATLYRRVNQHGIEMPGKRRG